MLTTLGLYLVLIVSQIALGIAQGKSVRQIEVMHEKSLDKIQKHLDDESQILHSESQRRDEQISRIEVIVDKLCQASEIKAQQIKEINGIIAELRQDLAEIRGLKSSNPEIKV